MTCDMYQLVDGTAGESTDKNHSGYSDIVSLSWGASQHSSMQSGGGGGAGKVSFSDLTVTAEMDKATPTLLKFCASGKHIASVKLSICKAGGTQIEYATIVLTDVLVTSVQFAGTGSETIHVNYSYQASKVEQHYWVQGKDGTKGPETQMGWDIKQNVAT